jgi:hypothetical protein
MLLHQLLGCGTYSTRVHFVDLLSGHPGTIGCSLDGPSDEGATVFRVGEILAMKDLEFPVLLDESIDEDSIVVERGPEDGMEHACNLHRGYTLWSETM